MPIIRIRGFVVFSLNFLCESILECQKDQQKVPLTFHLNPFATTAKRTVEHFSKIQDSTNKRLATGSRINTAKDDAAGLANTTRMDATIRGNNQTIRNLNDGISVAQVAGEGIEEATNVMQRMRELVVKSASSVYSQDDRALMDVELTALKKELGLLATHTEFDGQKLLDGSFNGLDVQLGESESIALNISVSLDVDVVTSDLMAAYAFNGDANDNSGNEYHGTIENDFSFEEDRYGNANSALSLSDLTPGNPMTSDGRVNLPSEVLNGLSALTISFHIKTTDIGAAILSGANNTQDNEFLMYLGDGVGSPLLQYINGTSNSMIGTSVSDGNWHNVVTTWTGSTVKTYVDGTLSGTWDSAPIGPLNIAANGLWIGEEQDDVGIGNQVAQRYDGLIDDLMIYNDASYYNVISVSSQALAKDSLLVIDQFMTQFSETQSDIGAFQNRLQSVNQTLQKNTDNTIQARSRILDADFGEEIRALSVASIIRKSATEVLAHAHKQLKILLKLIG